ncbi:ferrochelatase [Microlunatus flavus]|uniref:Coproporphyrin III ferrochelatase n=1 Tax=Microlunatus flavus TaxID=1036181 RepID=A0A1H9NKN7_9ACTN|nr:ferrochelatase [Microlunatus flavus]SER35953.1 ferrochelatase [Microlunatus flavus]
MPDRPGPAAPQADTAPYDALLLVSFGGPEKPDDVMPFLENVTRGRGIPRERLADVAHHYDGFGGRSPINDQCRDLLAALRTELDGRGLDIPLYWGNRNWDPYLAPEVERIVADGHRRVVAVLTSAYPSYSSCRQYRENLFDAFDPQSAAGATVDKIRHYSDHPGFVQASVDATLAALDELGAAGEQARLVYVTHSIPTAMAQAAGPQPRSAEGGYVDWHLAVAEAVTREVGARLGRTYDFDLVYCSRSGPPSQPWLEPDVNDHLAALEEGGVPGVVLVPIGFVSDHMEVIYDLDTEAVETARELGLPLARAATAGTHPAFVAALVDLVLERAAAARGEQPAKPVVEGGPVGWYDCEPDCCTNLRNPGRPALCQRVVQPA